MRKKRVLLSALVFMLLAFLSAASAQEEKVIMLPSGVMQIGEEAFSDDASITAVLIPGAVSIADNAFSGCENIKTLIILGNTVSSFENAFSLLPIERVYCPVGSEAEAYYEGKGIQVYPVSEYASDGEFQSEIQGAGVVITGYTGTETLVQIPSAIRGLPVVAVGERAFYENQTILSVIVPEGVASIGKHAFFGCRALESVILPGSITKIGDYAFQNARNIKAIDLSRNLRSLGENPFLNCALLSNVTGLEENPYYAFSEGMISDVRQGKIVSYLTNMRHDHVVIPKGITSVGKYAFSYAQTLSSVTFSASVLEIEDFAFYECPSLKTVHAEGVLKEIGKSAFQNCEGLSAVHLREGLTHVGDYAFKNCRSLPEITLPETVEYQGKGVFEIDKRFEGTVMSIVPLFQFHYNKIICVIRGEEKSVKTSGCGATCVAMIIRYIKGNYNETPETIFEWMYKMGFYKGSGLSHQALSAYLSKNSISSRWTGSTTDVINNLKAGKPVIAHMGPGLFADNGHYILLRGIDENGKILINDPNSRSLTEQSFSIQFIKSQLKAVDGFCIVK